MRVLLVSTYDLGRQPTGLALPAASLRAAGVDVECVDASRDQLADASIAAADLVAVYLPMHTATRLAAPILDRVRAVNDAAVVAAYGLYAPLNAGWLRDHGVGHVLGPEAEDDLVALAADTAAGNAGDRAGANGSDLPGPEGPGLRPGLRDRGRVRFLQPDRTTLPALSRYAALQMPDGTRRVVGTTDATRGCKHLCRHCPIVPVYRGMFRAIPLDLVMADVRAQVAAGAQHITFGDPDFFNGPTHARKLLEQFAAEFPGVTYDVTIKIEHLLAHAGMLPLLAGTGCLFVTSAVEAVDDAVLAHLRKGHTRADFREAVDRCRAAGLTLVPTFVAFTPWTTPAGYRELLDEIVRLDLVDAVAPIQLAIRLLVTADSALLELPEIRGQVDAFDPVSLTWPWRHADARVDALQRDVMTIAGRASGSSRQAAFAQIYARALGAAGAGVAPMADRPGRGAVPYLTEGWYCCAEPGPEMVGEL